MGVHAAVLVMDLRVVHSASLKDKRAVVRPILDGARNRFGVSVSETGDHDLWQRAELAFAAVGSGPVIVDEVLDSVERFVWSFPEVDVVAAARHWTDMADWG
jgi:uncharacterized protein YlxP (DUF503 family)